MECVDTNVIMVGYARNMLLRRENTNAFTIRLIRLTQKNEVVFLVATPTDAKAGRDRNDVIYKSMDGNVFSLIN